MQHFLSDFWEIADRQIDVVHLSHDGEGGTDPDRVVLVTGESDLLVNCIDFRALPVEVPSDENYAIEFTSLKSLTFPSFKL